MYNVGLYFVIQRFSYSIKIFSTELHKVKLEIPRRQYESIVVVDVKCLWLKTMSSRYIIRFYLYCLLRCNNGILI